VKYGYQVLRDGPWSQTAITYSVSSEVFRLSDSPLELHPQSAVGRAIQARGAATTRAAVVTQVSAANQATQWQNERVYAALEQTTGQNHSTPQAWWNWWVKHNELLVAEHKPLHSRHYYYHRPMAIVDRLHPQLPPPLGPRRPSCFIAGTLVWTEAGLEPIENLRPGDRVLSQDPDTGELSLRFVVETTLRPASPTRRVQVGEEVIVATLGHPFWAAGKGWRMAKELEAVDRLHTLEGAVPIASVEDGPDWEAHNLVIEGFGTYFVGKAGLLVRDNNLGEVVTTPLPGYRTVAAVPQAAR
jgi:hypothetical protein